MKFDKETAEHMRQGDEIRNFVESEGWALVKEMLFARMRLLDSVSSLPIDMTLEEIGKQAMFRAHAISLIQSWIDDVEGRVDMHKQQAAMLAADTADEVIRKYSSSTRP